MKPYNPPVLEIGKYTFERKKYLMPKFLTFAQADIILAKSHHLPFLDELKEKMDNEIKEISEITCTNSLVMRDTMTFR